MDMGVVGGSGVKSVVVDSGDARPLGGRSPPGAVGSGDEIAETWAANFVEHEGRNQTDAGAHGVPRPLK